MGPSSFNDGNCDDADHQPKPRDASMGPSSFNDRNGRNFAGCHRSRSGLHASCTLAADRRSAERSAVLNGRKRTVIAGAITCGLERPRSGWAARSKGKPAGAGCAPWASAERCGQRRFRGRNRHQRMKKSGHSQRHAPFGCCVPDEVPQKTPAIAVKSCILHAWLNTGVSHQNVLTPCRTLRRRGARQPANHSIRRNRPCPFA